jgi:hypothetical protein
MREKAISWKAVSEHDPENSKGIVKQIEERESVERFKAHLLTCKANLKEWRKL